MGALFFCGYGNAAKKEEPNQQYKGCCFTPVFNPREDQKIASKKKTCSCQCARKQGREFFFTPFSVARRACFLPICCGYRAGPTYGRSIAFSSDGGFAGSTRRSYAFYTGDIKFSANTAARKSATRSACYRP